MGKIRDAVKALTRCLPCQGTGQVPHYGQGANEITKNGRVVGATSCTVMRTCPTCGGSGR